MVFKRRPAKALLAYFCVLNLLFLAVPLAGFAQTVGISVNQNPVAVNQNVFHGRITGGGAGSLMLLQGNGSNDEFRITNDGSVNLYSNNLTTTGSIRSSSYCDAAGANCFSALAASAGDGYIGKAGTHTAGGSLNMGGNTIINTGNVGIGVAAPGVRLDVSGGAGTAIRIIGGGDFTIDPQVSGGASTFYNDTGTMTLSTGLTANGGVTSINNGGNQFNLQTASRTWSLDVDTGASNNFRLRDMTAGTVPLIVDTNGDLTAGGEYGVRRIWADTLGSKKSGDSLELQYDVAGDVVVSGGDSNLVVQGTGNSSFAGNVGMSGSLTVNGEIYTNGWLRNNNNNTGLYNQNNGNHWYSDGTYWKAGNNNADNGGIQLRYGHEGALKGYVYWDSAGFGLLNNQGNWGVRIPVNSTDVVIGGDLGLNNNRGISATMADNDFWKIYSEGGSNDGHVVFETGDDADEGFIFRQRMTYAPNTVRDAMIIDEGGSVGIGTNAVCDSCTKLQVNGSQTAITAAGNLWGVQGSGSSGGLQGSSASGNGVEGNSTDGNGLYGTSDNGDGLLAIGYNGAGVVGLGHWVGVSGTADNPGSGSEEYIGVYGQSVTTNEGFSYGVWAYADNPNGDSIGLFASGDNAIVTSGRVGVYSWGSDYDFYAGNANGKSVFDGRVGIGQSNPTTKLHVRDNTANNDNPAILGEHNVTDYYGVGVKGVSRYQGVVGEARITDDGSNNGSNSYYGVYGDSYTYGTGSTYGVYGYGRSDGGTGYGVYGNGNSYDFYAGGGGTNYAPFTGAHEVRLASDFGEVEKGMIVSVTGDVRTRDGSISNTLPEVRLASAAKDKNVLGALVMETKFGGDWIELPEGTRVASVNALGEGMLWVTNYGGELETGDYITTSPVAGYGMLQDDDVTHSYTVGKVTQTIDWNSITDTVSFEGQEYKKALITVIYLAG